MDESVTTQIDGLQAQGKSASHGHLAATAAAWEARRRSLANPVGR